MNEAKTAITYARVSGEEQAKKGYSLADQREALRHWCAGEGYEILEGIEDAGHSGAYMERPGLDRLRDLVAVGGVSAVVVQDRDRFAREPAYVYLLKKELEEHGTRLVPLNARGDGRPPANTRRFWQLSGGIARCGVCGNGFSTHHVYEPGKIRFYYQCYKRYNYGLDECSNNRHMAADVTEEAVWQAVYSIITNRANLRRQWQEHIDRRLRQLRGNPDRNARVLVQRLQKLESKRSSFIDLAGDGTIDREDLRAKLAEVDGQRDDFRKALRETQGRQQTIKQLMFDRDHNLHLVEGLGGGRFVSASPRDRHRIYKALQLRVEIDEDRTIRLSGMFSPSLHLSGMV